jgi:hypothetical protein
MKGIKGYYNKQLPCFSPLAFPQIVILSVPRLKAWHTSKMGVLLIANKDLTKYPQA